MEHKETARYEAAAADERDLQIKSDTLWYAVMPLMQFFMCFGEFIILFFVGNSILDGSMTVGEMSKFSLYTSMIYGPLRMFSNMPRRIIDFLTSANKVFEIIDESEEIADAADAKALDIKGDIDINHVSFGYDSGSEVLTNIDLHIKSGEFIGLVGRSGVGKSTLINLIMRMYDVEDGSICVDGVDIRDISQDSLRSQMGVVLQETFLFSGTIYQNIAYAKPDAPREEVIAVAKLAGCHDFIIKLPDGYDTKVGEKGHSLSGGERQRVAIARALLHNPKILILDEATASLDTETEKQIQDALQNLSKNRTTIAIAHRLSTLRNATRLVVLDKGRIAEVGTHDELVEKKGIYYGLVMAQREMSRMEG
jgi:ATP-binding cassette subfamily B protein